MSTRPKTLAIRSVVTPRLQFLAFTLVDSGTRPFTRLNFIECLELSRSPVLSCSVAHWRKQ